MGFNRYLENNTTTRTTVITCPVDTVITIIGISVANVSGNVTDITIELNNTKLIHNATLTEGSAFVPVGGDQKVVMVAGDTLAVTAEYEVDTIVSVLEQTV